MELIDPPPDVEVFIGLDILLDCRLLLDGPGRQFTLDFRSRHLISPVQRGSCNCRTVTWAKPSLQKPAERPGRCLYNEAVRECMIVSCHGKNHDPHETCIAPPRFLFPPSSYARGRAGLGMGSRHEALA